MSGGVVYVYEPVGRLPLRLNETLVEAEQLAGPVAEELQTLLERHGRYTRSPRAARLLERWEDETGSFWRVAPRAYAAVLQSAAEGARGGSPGVSGHRRRRPLGEGEVP